MCNFISPSFQPSNCPSWVLLRPWMYRIRRHRQQRQREKTKPQPCTELISHNPSTLDPAVSSHSPSVTSSFLHSSQLRPTFHFRHSPQFCCILSHCAHTHRLMYCTWHWPCIAVLLYNVMWNITLVLSLRITHGRPCTCMHANIYACTHWESGI